MNKMLLAEIKDKDLGLEEKKEKIDYRIRNAARAVLFNKDKKIAVLFVSKNNYHKIPGGGIKEGETINDALQREVLEETGCSFEIKDKVGEILEFRDEFKIKQTSYCFIAEVKEIVAEPKFTEKESAQGFKLLWIDLDEAIDLLEKDEPKNYEGKFIQKRDLILLKKVKEIIK